MCLGREGLFRRGKKIHKTGSFIGIHMHKGYWTMNKRLPEYEEKWEFWSVVQKLVAPWWPSYKSDTNQTL